MSHRWVRRVYYWRTVFDLKFLVVSKTGLSVPSQVVLKPSSLRSVLAHHAKQLSLGAAASIAGLALLVASTFAADSLRPAETTVAEIPNASDTSKVDPARQLQQSLDGEQRLLAEQFGNLEELFIRLSELEGSENPTRANLLQQAAQLSKQLATQQRLSVAGDFLVKGQYTRALQEQEAARDNLKKLMELLRRENRSERLKDDRQRIQELIKEVQRIGRLQRSLRGRTEAGQEQIESIAEQKSLKEQAGKLAEKLEATIPEQDKTKDEKPAEKDNADESGDKSDADKKQEDELKPKTPEDADAKKSDDQKSEAEKSEDQKSEAEKSDAQKPDGKQSDAEQSPQNSDSKKSDSSSPPKEGEKSSGDGKPSESQPQTPEQRARDRVEKAQQRMKQAGEQLEEDQVDKAVEEQRAAEAELAQASEELEQSLKQMREEETERALADLESRFRRMLAAQTEILTQTQRYADEDAAVEARQIELQSIKLSIEERKVLIEGQRAMLLLEEEGSSMAFPEAVEQINGDLAIAIEYFNLNRLDKTNVELQQQVIATLEELIDSLTATQEAMEKKKKQQQQGQQGPPPPQQDQALVDALAELRLIKTLQLRINKRTSSLAQQAGVAEDPQGRSEDPLLNRQVRELSQRQFRVERVIREIVLEAARKK